MMKTTMGVLLATVALSLGAAQVYQVPKEERIYDGYAVEVDGEQAPVSEVRCSAIPFNRRWPGYQRQIEQTELCGMVRFAIDGKATVKVTAAKDFNDVKIRPLSRNVAIKRAGRTVTFDIVRPGGYSVEFDGYHNNLHVFADPMKRGVPHQGGPSLGVPHQGGPSLGGPRPVAASSEPKDRPSNVITFGPGVHDIGIRTLKSGDTVYIDPGAIVYGGFHASNVTDIAVVGRGILDASRIKEKILFPATGDGHEAVKNAKRWHTFDLRNCRNIKIDGIVIRDSLLYNIAAWGCEDIAISNVKIVGQWRFNTDGIDLHNCRRARVTDCFARTYDDTFCFKAHEGYGNCEDCVFERCVAWNDWGKAFEVGVECRAEHLRRLAFRDCDCIHAVSWTMDVSNVDYGRVSDVTFDNIRVEKDDPMPASQLQATDASPFDPAKGLNEPPRLFCGIVHFHHEYSKENGGKWSGGGHIDGVTLRDVNVITDGRKPLVMLGAIDAQHRPENIVFENLKVNGVLVDEGNSATAVQLSLGKNTVPPKFTCAATSGVTSCAEKWPFIVIRHTSAINDSPETFARLIDCHRRHRGACDEFWFSGGGRSEPKSAAEKCAAFARFRPLCDEVGIALSYQQGLTLGHGEAHDGKPRPDEQKFPDDAWQVDQNGKRIHILCPRSPDVIAYERAFAKAVIGTANPASYWLDDDLRLGIHKPNGCFCERCIAAFNAKTGGNWTRETLTAQLFSKDKREPVRAAWSAFNSESLALYAAAVRQAADELKSPCRLAYQSVWSDRTYTADGYRPLLEALAGKERKSVGIRPGAGFYTEAEPRGMVKKCLSVAREAERCRTYGGLVASICYEQETYPRHVLHKSPGAIMTESALALASGCDSLSLYWYSHSAPEPIVEYGRFLKTLAAARPYFERLAASTRRTHLGGVARFVGSAALETADFDLRDPVDFDLACAGIPVTVAEADAKVWYVTEKSLREMTDADKATLAKDAVVDVAKMEKYPLASRRAKLLDDIDAATGGAFPVRIDACRPLRILPRVREDGSLDSVTILNLSIGDTDELKVRVRKPISANAFWQDAQHAPSRLDIKRGTAANEQIVTIPNMTAWQIGTIFFD